MVRSHLLRRGSAFSITCLAVSAVLAGASARGAEIVVDDAPAVKAGPQDAVAQRVQAQIEAGEFGPALDLIRNVTDEEQRSELLRRVAAAQSDAGEYDSALYSIRRMPSPALRDEAGRERAQDKNLAGGALIPDFQRLENLIQLVVRAEWDDGSGTGDDDVGSMEGDITGVLVDPNGLMQTISRPERQGLLEALGARAREAALNDDMARPSELRFVSLTRLEQAVARQIAEGRPVVSSMKHLAGLSKIQYVIAYPEDGEILIGGPAEPWQYTAEGLPVGASSGRPTLQLDDLVTVMRTFSTDGSGMFNCLIVPRQEGLKAVKEFVDSSNSPLQPGRVKDWTLTLQEKLGLQDVEVNGVPLDSRVARVIVEADYRMKLIGVGKLSPVRSIPSFFDLLAKTKEQNVDSVDALRWWLTMQYQAVMHSPDREAFEIQGSSVLCLSENELITAQGQRVPTRQAEETNRRFAEEFTSHYDELAKADPIFADLQNVFDLSLVAALIRSEGLDQRTGWNGGVFAAGGDYEPARYAPPKTVMSVVNHRVYNRKNIVVQVAGGVKGDVLSVARNDELRKADAGLEAVETKAAVPQLPAGRWWWDAK